MRASKFTVNFFFSFTSLLLCAPVIVCFSRGCGVWLRYRTQTHLVERFFARVTLLTTTFELAIQGHALSLLPSVLCFLFWICFTDLLFSMPNKCMQIIIIKTELNLALSSTIVRNESENDGSFIRFLVFHPGELYGVTCLPMWSVNVHFVEKYFDKNMNKSDATVVAHVGRIYKMKLIMKMRSTSFGAAVECCCATCIVVSF